MLILTILMITAYADSSSPHVRIEQGLLRGQYLQTVNGRIISSFTGIPYAEPPVGPLRFEIPRPARGWNGVRNAIELHSVCTQTNIFDDDYNVKGNEDCLYLNVYTPQVTCCDIRNLPVMIFFHGGGFITGDGNYDSYGPNILLDKDVVLVVPNYRLGPLGFLSTGDKVVPGNNGLKDQNLAIKWIKANIVQFGGDPGRITVVGQSAGGASAHFHMLSPLSKDLINGAICESGTALAPWVLATKDETERNFKRLAQSSNCFAETNRKIVDCLKGVSADELIRLQDTLYAWYWHPLTAFKAVIEPNLEGAFLPDHPANIIKSGRAANIPFMTGITTEDGATVSADIFGKPTRLEELIANLNSLLPITLLYDETSPHRDSVTEKIKKFYFGHRELSNTSIVELTNLYTEGHFLASENNAIRLHLNNVKAPVYNYAFGYRGTVSFSSIYGDPFNDYGVCHSDELLYLFPLRKVFPNYTPSYTDRIMSEILTTLWTNFVATGDPTPTTNPLIPERWQRVTSENLEYFLIRGVNDIKMDERLFSERAEFWKHLPLQTAYKV